MAPRVCPVCGADHQTCTNPLNPWPRILEPQPMVTIEYVSQPGFYFQVPEQEAIARAATGEVRIISDPEG